MPGPPGLGGHTDGREIPVHRTVNMSGKNVQSERKCQMMNIILEERGEGEGTYGERRRYNSRAN